MNRREVITVLAGAATSLPLVGQAQQPVMPVIGFLNNAAAEQFAHNVTGFRLGLKEMGYVEGQNVAVEYRWADGLNDRSPVTGKRPPPGHRAVRLRYSSA